MSLLLWIILFTALGGVMSAVAAAALLTLPGHATTRLLSPLVSFAIGALLGAAFVALLPHALEGAGPDSVHAVALAVLFGLLAFFLLEKLVVWRHCHVDECEAHGHATAEVTVKPGNPVTIAEVSPQVVEEARRRAVGKMVLVGDGIHNLVDGVLIGAAFLTDVHLGVVTSFAVIVHEIPQELGDFVLLLNSGYSRARALAYNALAGLTTIIGGVVAYFALSFAQQVVPYVLAVAASSFIYIAVADLIPGLHKRPEVSATAQQVTLISLGVAIIFVAHSLLH